MDTNKIEFLDLTINFTHKSEDGTNHLIKVHMERLEHPSLQGMYEVGVVEGRVWIGRFKHAGDPDVQSARLFAQAALLNRDKDPE